MCAFTVTYGGPASDGGRIPVRDLAPSVLALSDLVAAASVLVDPDRAPATLSIDSIDPGSPTVRLVISIDDRTDRLTDLLATDATAVLEDVLDVVVGEHGLLQLTRRARNRTIATAAPQAPATACW